MQFIFLEDEMIVKDFPIPIFMRLCSDKPDRSNLTGKADGGVLKRRTKECEAITVDHFKEVYGSIARIQKKGKES
jgi:hypothetical protein